MPKISAEAMKDRERALVAAAREVFASKGYEGATTSDIARAAGVSEGLVYRYFLSKRELLQAVLDVFYTRLIEDLEACVAATSDFETRFLTLIAKHIEVFVSDMDLCRLFIAEVRNFGDYVGSETHALNRRYTSVLMRILADGRAEGRVADHVDGRIVRDMLFGGIEHIAWRHITSRHSIDVQAIARQVSGLLIGGLRGASTS